MRTHGWWLGVLLIIASLCGAVAGCGGHGGSSATANKIVARSVDSASVLERMKNPPKISSVVRKQDAGSYSTYYTWVVNGGGDIIGEFETGSIPSGQEIIDRYPDLFGSPDQFSQPAAAVCFEHWESMNIGPAAGYEFY